MTHVCTFLGIADCYAFFKDFTPALVAVIVGLLAALLSFRQWRIAREKLRLDLFDKRIKVFNGFMNKVRNDMGEANLTQEQYSDSMLDIASLGFLFPKPVVDEMNAIHAITQRHRGRDKRWQALNEKGSEAEERTALVLEMRALREDYDARIKALIERLGGIMNFSRITH